LVADENQTNLQRGRSTLSDAALNLYPNPSGGSLFVDLSPWEGQTVRITLLNGQGGVLEAIAANATESPVQFDMEGGLPNGLYFIALTTGTGERKVQRFLLQR
jgi:hypothetical protein